MDQPSSTPYPLTRALGLWVLYTLILFLFGGIAAGLTWLAFSGLFGHEISDIMYAVIFGVTGFIAYQLMRPLVEARTRRGD